MRNSIDIQYRPNVRRLTPFFVVDSSGIRMIQAIVKYTSTLIEAGIKPWGKIPSLTKLVSRVPRRTLMSLLLAYLFFMTLFDG